ncbi:SLC13 family permease [Halospeciosus flavus]|uniref:SLC13 family permease n=1 Tax=Halospeciosus flavus TaxID=3032283 RepID=UPI003607C77A
MVRHDRPRGPAGRRTLPGERRRRPLRGRRRPPRPDDARRARPPPRGWRRHRLRRERRRPDRSRRDGRRTGGEYGGRGDGPRGLPPLSPKTPLALGIVAGVIGVAALGLLPIVVAALGGVVLMVATGCLTTSEAYDAVSWRVFFLLAGVLPLGLAMRETGGAEFLAGLLVSGAEFLPAVALLALFYLLTGLLANVITPVASVVLMIPVAVDTAQRVGAEAFSFLLAVMFASSAAFMTPIGYQTNLMVYGPGGYTFSDFLRVGAPLQLLLTAVTALGIAAIWGV